MRILLLQEYSGLHNNLKEGLLELGHQVTIASRGDGWKKFPTDINLEAVYFDASTSFGKIERQIIGLSSLSKLTGYDVVQTISPKPYTSYLGFNKWILGKILNNNEKSFYLAAGCDSFFYQSRKEKKYSPCVDCLNIDKTNNWCVYSNKTTIDANNNLVSNVNGVIPIMYDYYLAYRKLHNIRKIIPIPVNLNNFVYRENVVKNKIKIFHGINRKGFKGSNYIIDAMKEIQRLFPSEVELQIVEKMPFKKYIETITNTNVILDQTNSYSYGLNALFSMAYGKVTLSGNEIINGRPLHANCPVINIQPSKEQIINQLRNLIIHKNDIPEMGFQSRKYVEKNHSHILVAKKYINAWNL